MADPNAAPRGRPLALRISSPLEPDLIAASLTLDAEGPAWSFRDMDAPWTYTEVRGEDDVREWAYGGWARLA